MANLKIKLVHKDFCTGCSACHDICNHDAINMVADNELHYYPIIDSEKCVGCGRCMSVCPSLHLEEIREKVSSSDQRFYYSWHEHLNERLASTSGGVGSAILENALHKGFYICSASFDARWNLAHKISDNSIDIELFRGSKYLQSDTKNIFKKIFSLLRDNKNILFLGTPCQVEALMRFVPQRYHVQLITCGIICHGVNSPIVWKDYVKYLETKNKSQLLKYNFRAKSRGWQKANGSPILRVSYAFESGKTKDVPAWNNLFHSWFGKHYILRPSCFNCIYRVENRNSDITIGDFWGVNKVVPGISTKEGVSVLITSTIKGELFLNSCDNLFIQQIDSDKAIPVLKGFIDKTPNIIKEKEIALNNLFREQYLSMSFRNMAKKYPETSFIGYLINLVKYIFHINEK